jgi:hypothetical protein
MCDNIHEFVTKNKVNGRHDLIIIKDVLQHNTEKIREEILRSIIQNKQSKYLLIVEDCYNPKKIDT